MLGPDWGGTKVSAQLRLDARKKGAQGKDERLLDVGAAIASLAPALEESLHVVKDETVEEEDVRVFGGTFMVLQVHLKKQDKRDRCADSGAGQQRARYP